LSFTFRGLRMSLSLPRCFSRFPETTLENEGVKRHLPAKIQKVQFRLEKDFTFYSSVIGHAYYCIFNSAKAILLTEGIKTYPPEVHRKTIDAFEAYLVKTGKLDVQLLNIYRKSIIQADQLLEIFSEEKQKRGDFTYQKLPQANMGPASLSMERASLFFKNISGVLRG
jgi:uncharacterized protein (UPF0332 family)